MLNVEEKHGRYEAPTPSFAGRKVRKRRKALGERLIHIARVGLPDRETGGMRREPLRRAEKCEG